MALTESRWLAAAALILANACWGLQGPAIPTLVQQYARPDAVRSTYGVINGLGNLVSAALPTLMGVAIAAGGAHGFAAGYTLLAATQAITLLGACAMLRTRPPIAVDASVDHAETVGAPRCTGQHGAKEAP